MNFKVMAEEALSITASRRYFTPNKEVHLPGSKPSTYYSPDTLGLLPFPIKLRETTVEVTTQTTLAAMREHCGPDTKVAALNFASAKHPGGGFLRGAQAQEESIARSSTLYEGLVNSQFYDENKYQHGLYTDGIIWSPEVWVFRDDYGVLLDDPYVGGIITCPAVNHNALMDGHELVDETMARRGRRILEVAGHHKTDVLILGAWGCGIFRNDPAFVATMFREHLRGDFKGVFAKVIFPIYGGGVTHTIFERAFA